MNTYRKTTLAIGTILLLMISVSSCTSVKEYQKAYLNDAEMQMGSNSGRAFMDYVHGIRTGGVIAGTKKSTGGCGCN